MPATPRARGAGRQHPLLRARRVLRAALCPRGALGPIKSMRVHGVNPMRWSGCLLCGGGRGLPACDERPRRVAAGNGRQTTAGRADSAAARSWAAEATERGFAVCRCRAGLGRAAIHGARMQQSRPRRAARSRCPPARRRHPRPRRRVRLAHLRAPWPAPAVFHHELVCSCNARARGGQKTMQRPNHQDGFQARTCCVSQQHASWECAWLLAPGGGVRGRGRAPVLWPGLRAATP